MSSLRSSVRTLLRSATRISIAMMFCNNGNAKNHTNIHCGKGACHGGPCTCCNSAPRGGKIVIPALGAGDRDVSVGEEAFATAVGTPRIVSDAFIAFTHREKQHTRPIGRLEVDVDLHYHDLPGDKSERDAPKGRRGDTAPPHTSLSPQWAKHPATGHSRQLSGTPISTIIYISTH